MDGKSFCPLCGSPLHGGTPPRLDSTPAASQEAAEPSAWDRVIAGVEAASHLVPPRDPLSRGLFGSTDDAPRAATLKESNDRTQSEISASTNEPIPPGALPGESTRDELATETERAGSTWPRALLASYASAVTLACLWLWWRGETPRTKTPSSPVAEQENRDASAYRVKVPSPLEDDRRLSVGQAIRIGQVELTPLRIESRSVILQRDRMDGQSETKEGAKQALWLHLRIANRSSTHVFKPLDEKLVRQNDRQFPDCFIQRSDGERCFCYALPVLSEWVIEHQDFPALRPGESAEVVIVSDGTASTKLRGEMGWRLRVRSSPDQTEELEVRFRPEDVVAFEAAPAS